MALETTASLKQALYKMEQIDADLQNRRQLIATAVTGKDVPTNGSDSFQKMADNIDSIKTKLPILEGDVGVAEDSEGNVYGVNEFRRQHIYSDKLKKVQKVWEYGGHSASITSMAIDKEGFIYSVSDDYSLIITSPDGIKLNQIKYTDKLTSIAVDNDGFIYIGLYNSPMATLLKISKDLTQVWSYTDEFMYRITSIALDNNGFIYVASEDNAVRKINNLGELIWKYKGHTGYVLSVAVDKDGNVYSGSADKSVRRISPEGNEIWRLNDVVGVNSVVVDNEGCVYSGNGNGVVKKISSEGKEIWSYSNSSWVNCLAIDSDNYIYCGYDLTVRKLDRYGELMWQFTSSGYAFNTIGFYDQGNIYTNKTSTLINLKDNVSIEKIAVLKEREVQ
jgi:hypothetical protein